MTHLPGLGPKRARRLYEELGIDSLPALEQAANAQKIRELKGFGPKAEERLLQTVQAARERAAGGGRERRRHTDRARPGAGGRRAAGRGAARPPGVRSGRAGRVGAADDRQRQGPRRHRDRARPAGAGARGRRSWSWCEAAQTPGEAGVRLRTHTGLRSTCGSSRPTSSATCCSTSPAPSSTTWRCAQRRSARDCTCPSMACSTTSPARPTAARPRQQVYALLGLRLHRARAAREPRRARGGGPARAAAADRGRRPTRRPALPHHRLRRHRLDRRDGAGGAGRGLRVPGDHRPLGGRFGTRLDRRTRCASTSRRIRALSGTDEVEGITLLAGSEVNIAPDGSLDYDDELLAELDWVVASVHSSFRDGRRRDDRADRARDREPAGRRDRPPHRPQDRAPPAVRARFPGGARCGRAGRDDARDQRQPRSAATSTTRTRAPPRQAGVGDRDQLRRSPHRRLRGRALWDRHRAPRLAGRRAVLNTRPWAELAALRPRAFVAR